MKGDNIPKWNRDIKYGHNYGEKTVPDNIRFNLDHPYRISKKSFVAYPYDYSQEEVDEFMESLTSDVIKQITLFFQTMPRLKNSIKYTNSNGDEKTFVIEGMQTFFS